MENKLHHKVCLISARMSERRIDQDQI